MRSVNVRLMTVWKIWGDIMGRPAGCWKEGEASDAGGDGKEEALAKRLEPPSGTEKPGGGGGMRDESSENADA